MTCMRQSPQKLRTERNDRSESIVTLILDSSLSQLYYCLQIDIIIAILLLADRHTSEHSFDRTETERER